jgi:hypothetical protein
VRGWVGKRNECLRTGDLVSGEANLLQVNIVLEDSGQLLKSLVVNLVLGEVEDLDVLVVRESLQ